MKEIEPSIRRQVEHEILSLIYSKLNNNLWVYSICCDIWIKLQLCSFYWCSSRITSEFLIIVFIYIIEFIQIQPMFLFADMPAISILFHLIQLYTLYKKYKNRKKRPYMRLINKYRATKSELRLVTDLRSFDVENHSGYFRMSTEVFDELLALVSPTIEHKKTHRYPICGLERLSMTLKYNRLLGCNIFPVH